MTTPARLMKVQENGGVHPRTSKVLNLDTLNPNIKMMEYAVRGPIIVRAAQLERELQQGVIKPFDKVIRANIGNAHAMGQRPITFLRQVVALCTYPGLLESQEFPADAKAHASDILAACLGGSIGSYSDSAGLEPIRKHVAEYIHQRDGVPVDYAHILLSNGASDSIKYVLQLLMKPSAAAKAGVMIPIPQYPLYTATLAEFGAQPIPYYLDEGAGWGLDISELERALQGARGTCDPRAIVIINPGNPTGQVLTRQNIEDIIKFAAQERLFILADEVYQHNVYAEGSAFHSFKKVLADLGEEYDHVELASFMSASKGFAGECGYRGGCCELVHMEPDVLAQLNKYIHTKLCPSVTGQAALDCVVNPPQAGDPSHDTYTAERDGVLKDLALKAQMTSDALNAIDGITCNPVMGAMYAFPRLHLPPGVLAAAESKQQTPDTFYCNQLLEETGVCVVPGSGFGQRPGTHHFRMTILPSVELLREMLDKIQSFHEAFICRYL